MSVAKIKLTQAELEEHLTEQIGFIESSAEAFDLGRTREAKRLALAIRILVHDTGHSVSLLSQLEKKDGLNWISTATPAVPDSKIAHGSIVWIAQRAEGAQYFAMLDEAKVSAAHPFDAWWNEIVFVDRRQRALSRRDLVLTIANQDGGGHVDPWLKEVYADLKKDSLGLVHVDGNKRQILRGAELAAVRQIAHETLKTIVPGYEKQPCMDGIQMVTGQMSFGGTNVDGWRVRFGSVETMPLKQGRNERCACGSGKKYKHCHGLLR